MVESLSIMHSSYYVAVTQTQHCFLFYSTSSTVSRMLPHMETMWCICVDSTKEGYKTYIKWKRTWSSHPKAEANVKLFLVDQYLPFWVQCTCCGRWRQLPNETILSPELIKSYKCDASMEVIALLMLLYFTSVFLWYILLCVLCHIFREINCVGKKLAVHI